MPPAPIGASAAKRSASVAVTESITRFSGTPGAGILAGDNEHESYGFRSGKISGILTAASPNGGSETLEDSAGDLAS